MRTLHALLVLFLLAAIGLAGSVQAQTPVVEAKNAEGDSVFVSNTDGGFAAFGELLVSASSPILAEGPGIRMMWYPKKRAFRVGQVSGSEWDDINTGSYSVAMGLDPTASGFGSVALGEGVTASGTGAVVIGGDVNQGSSVPSEATGDQAVVLGHSAMASGKRAVAIGSELSSGSGYSVVASGEGAMALGPATASGFYATGVGAQAAASGDFSTAIGYLTTAATDESITVGTYNSANTSPDNSLFVVGNGDLGTGIRSDALVLGKDGNLEIAGTLTESSDRRLKTDIQPFGPGALEKLRQIRPVRFRFKAGTGHPSGEQLGLVAQEVEAQFPALVESGSDGYLSVSYSKLTAVLLKGLQEQQAQITAQRAKTAALETRLAKLEAAMGQQRTVANGLAGWPGGLLGALLMLGLLAGGALAWRR